VRFSLFGIPVRVQPLFWVIALLIAPASASIFGGFDVLVVAWVAVVFASVIGHELGHALVARGFGAQVDMTLHGLGGYTRWHTPGEIGPWRRVVVAAAGSMTGFALAGVVWLLLRSGVIPSRTVISTALDWFVVVNLLWGVLNWLPIRPLDGGHIFLGVLQGALGDRGVKLANVLFPITTLVGGLIAWRTGFYVAAIFAAFLLLSEFREWTARSVRRSTLPEDDGPFTLFGETDQADMRGRESESTSEDVESVPDEGEEDSSQVG
jgi:Zn-dependent protease